MSHSLDSYYLDNTALPSYQGLDRTFGNAYSSSYDEFRGKASRVWDAATQKATLEDSSDLDDWEIVDCKSGFDNPHSDKMKEKANDMRNYILAGGTTFAAGVQKAEVGGFVLRHGLGFWAYASAQASTVQASTWTGYALSLLPTTVQQYACANVTASAAGAVTGTFVTVPLVGVVSAAGLATAGATLVLGLAAIKTAEVAYNATVQHEDQKVSLSLREIAKEVAGKIGF